MSNLKHRHKLARWFRAAAGVLVFASLAGCDRDEAKVYRVPKEVSPPVQPDPAPATPPATMADATPAPTAAPAQPAPGVPLTYQVPEGWQEKPLSEMRVASLSVVGQKGESADVSVIPLPVVGRDLELVNMWRSRVQLPPTTDPSAANQFEPVEIGPDPGRLFTFVSAEPIGGKSRVRLLEAMLTRGEMSWFFRMTGDDAFVVSQKKHFLEFLKSVSFVGEPPLPAAEIVSPARDDADSVWTIPPGWQPVPPAQFLTAQFLISGSNGTKAEVNVATLNGKGGGLKANVNRWRGQLGLEPMDDRDLKQLAQTFEVQDGKATLVEFSGKDSKTGAATRLVGALVSQSGQTWFYKMMGNDQLVSQQKSAFTQFIESANYANAR